MKINRQFGNYFVIRRIGVGGMAEIFLGLRRGPGEFEKLYALKAIMGGREKNPTFRHMFQTEAEAAARFNHPHVVQLYDVVSIDGADVMVMEYIPGHTLEEVVQIARARGQELPADLAVFLLMEVCEGLDYIHGLSDWDGTPLGIVHRDMSPQNIMVTYDGVAKVFDFGIAKLSTRPDNKELLGSMIGKLGYMPPEQVRGDHVDARADVFAVGCMLWELTVGRPLFGQKSDIQRINAVMEEPIPRPTEINERFPRLLERIILRALDRNPAARFSSCEELREELHKYLKISATKPDRRQAASFMSTLFATEIQQFRDDMAQGRQMAEEKDPTLNIDIHQLMASLHGQAVESEAAPAGGVVEMKPQVAAQAAHAAAPPAAAQAAQPAAPAAAPAPSGVSRGIVWGIVAAALLLIVAAGVLGYVVAGRGAAPAPPAAATSGSLKLETTPPGASVTLNGRRLSFQTPVTLPGLELGKPQRVTLELAGYAPVEREVTLEAARPEDAVEVTLEALVEREAAPAVGQVRLTVTPPEVVVYLDGARQGEGSPLTLEGITAEEEHALRLTAEGFEDAVLPFTLRAGEVKEFEVDLVESDAAELGVLSIDSAPSGRRVTIDDQFIGNTPIEGLRLPASVPLRVQIEGWQQSVVLKSGEVRALRADLSAAPEEAPEAAAKGSLTVSSTPPTTIWIDGREQGVSPVSGVELAAGSHTIEFRDNARHIGYAQAITVRPGAPMTLNVVIPQATLSIRSAPAGVAFVDGEEVGPTPVQTHKVYAGMHAVVVRVGEREKSFQLRLRGGETRTVNATFAAVEVAARGDKEVPVAPPASAPEQPATRPPKPPSEDDPYPLLK